jgi:hypothetical protein
MAVGDRIEIDGYVFYETMHGPLAQYACEECGALIYAAEERGRRQVNDPDVARCSTCWRRFHGLAGYGAGILRDES